MVDTCHCKHPSVRSWRVVLELTTMNKNHALSHPEIELRPSLFTTSRASKLQTSTILDLLEVYPDHVNWEEKLDHTALLNHFRVSGSYVISHS